MRRAGIRGGKGGLVSAIGAAAAVTLGLAGCGSSTPSPAARQAETSFVDAVHASDPQVGTYRTDTQLIRLGHAACDGFKSGASYQLLADRLALGEGPHPLPPADLGAVITNAVNAFCPQYRSQVF